MPLLEAILQPPVALHSEPRSIRDGVVILAGEKAGCQRGPNSGAYAVGLLEDWEVLHLETLPVKHVVLRLLELRRLQSFGVYVCVCGVCMVHVWCMYGVCMVYV